MTTKLTKTLVEVLDEIKPYDAKPDLLSEIKSGRCPIDGYRAPVLLMHLFELESLGMLRMTKGDDGLPSVFYLTGDGKDYHRNRKIDVASAVGRYILTVIAGGSGGLVVWALTFLADKYL